MDELNRRDHFLIAMYNQLMNDINRHIVVVWQSIATLVAAIAAFSLVKDNIISLDIAVSIVLITCIWMVAHVYDASHWYNRNLVIIANIEKQFLTREDLRNIHFYFGKHRPTGTMISHLKIQWRLGVSVLVLVLIFHIYAVLIPICKGTTKFEIFNAAPWIIAIAGCFIWYNIAKSGEKKYAEFLRNSPGIEVDTSGVEYRSGHGFNG